MKCIGESIRLPNTVNIASERIIIGYAAMNEATVDHLHISHVLHLNLHLQL